MKNVWQSRKLGEILLFVVAIIFALLFYRAGQYLLTFFALCLLVIALRVSELKTFIVNPKEGLTAHFRDADNKISEIVTSSKSPEEKREESQKIIDEVFKLGYLAGGGKPFNNIWNVKIRRDKDGRVSGYQYDEN
jgi:hypothetical protein